MPDCCEVCGAALPEGSTCQEIYESFLNLEFSDPAYGLVHYLTVTCFMVQHGHYSDESLVWAKSMLRAYLDGKMTTQQIRQQTTTIAKAGKHTWKIIRPADAPPLPKTNWSMTIVDVALNYQDSRTYCTLVTQWARATLQQMAS